MATYSEDIKVQSSPPVRRNRLPVVLGALALAAVVLAGAFYGSRVKGSAPARLLAWEKEDDAKKTAGKAGDDDDDDGSNGDDDDDYGDDDDDDYQHKAYPDWTIPKGECVYLTDGCSAQKLVGKIHCGTCKPDQKDVKVPADCKEKACLNEDGIATLTVEGELYQKVGVFNVDGKLYHGAKEGSVTQ